MILTELRHLRTAALSLLCLCAPLSGTFAAVTLADIFSDHAVLQRGERTPVWGTAAPGGKITVRVGTVSAEAVAGDDGRWMVFLNLQKEEEGPFDLSIEGAEGKVVRSDILIGEVWICSGQSNMHFHLVDSTGGAEEAAQASDSKLRFLSFGLKVADAPTTSFRDKWTLCDPASAGAFSAVGYHMGKTLRQQIKGPIGLINLSWAGICIETWMSPEALDSDADFKPILDRWAQKLADYPSKMADYEKAKPALLAAWQQEADAAKADGKPTPPKPAALEPPHGPGSLEAPSCFYNGEITPVAPYGIKGVLWYQGEQNVGRAFQYRKLLRALIADWRKLWGQGDFPFVVVQLPNYGKPETAPRSNNFAELREGQALATTLPNTALVVTIDVGEEGNIHPKDKKSVGVRAGRIIAKDFYGSAIPEEVHGPTFKEIAVEGDTLRLRFDHAGGLKTRDGQPPTDFAIAEADGHFVWAQAAIDGETIVLRGPGIAAPVMARYDWATAPHGNLCNGADLPAAPFRTDTLPVSTQGTN